MTPPYHRTPPSPNFPLDLNEDHQHDHHLFLAKPQASSSSSSFSSRISFNHADQDQRGSYYYRESKHFQNDQEVDKFVSQGDGSCDPLTLKDESANNGLKVTILNKEINKIEDQSETSSAKWMPSKMRMMRKMITSERTGLDTPLNPMQKYFEDQKQPKPPNNSENDNMSRNNSLNSSSNTAIRVCADCNTTKTPLWRSGPRGPKSLCNACGIRQRKARRAIAAAANGTILVEKPPSMKSAASAKVQHKDKRSSNCYVPKFKKKCKLSTTATTTTSTTTTPSHHHGRKKLCLEDFTISLSKNSAFQRVFPQDEKEAAILLMALSYGLVHG
ncbi:hypothetical protein F2P56_002473 [Juglans regia]|uniref:GATA transcription factor 21 isoform X1 n=2 Tax=Juglans regia TaxID=51240 RepID=A0A2I4GPD6_JUGRE|nr:GATA transcription factor 21 isoform X1 [Juglans regia]KAF5481854.1 hypothetical protein F2P56_002473 [Juglans regia]